MQLISVMLELQLQPTNVQLVTNALLDLNKRSDAQLVPTRIQLLRVSVSHVLLDTSVLLEQEITLLMSVLRVIIVLSTLSMTLSTLAQ